MVAVTKAKSKEKVYAFIRTVFFTKGIKGLVQEKGKTMRLIDLDAEKGYLLDGCYFVGTKNDIELKQGEWMPKNHHTDYCSECGFEETQWRTEDYIFCPNCGARMKGESDE